MGREEETAYGCFRCGAIQPKIVHSEDGTMECKECGEQGIVTFRQSLDMLNEIHRKDRKAIEEVIDFDEYYISEEPDGDD